MDNGLVIVFLVMGLLLLGSVFLIVTLYRQREECREELREARRPGRPPANPSAGE